VPTLQDLIEASIVIPGKNNITVSYKGTTYTASLEKDGSISYQGASSCLYTQLRCALVPCPDPPKARTFTVP